MKNLVKMFTLVLFMISVNSVYSNTENAMKNLQTAMYYLMMSNHKDKNFQNKYNEIEQAVGNKDYKNFKNYKNYIQEKASKIKDSKIKAECDKYLNLAQ